MDTRLQIVQRLYAEGEENHQPHPVRSTEGEDLTSEFQAMSEAKFWMDHRRRQRPDPATVDSIVRAATEASRGVIPGVLKPDRSPLRILTLPRVRLAVAAAFVVAMAGLGIWRAVLDTTDTGNTLSEAEPRTESERPLQEEALTKGMGEAVSPSLAFADADAADERAARRDMADDSSMRVGRIAPSEPMLMTASETDWDAIDDVARLRQRIEMLRSRQADEGWDKPVVPLEMMPTSDRAAGIQQAGAPGN